MGEEQTLDFWWDRTEKTRQKYSKETKKEHQSQSVHRLASLYAQQFTSLGRKGGSQNSDLTCTGFRGAAVAGAGVLAVALAVAAVEAGAGWGLEMELGCVEEGGFPGT